MEYQNIALTVPEMTKEQYARHVGVSLETVEGWIKRGYLPAFKLGKYKMINVAKRTQECIDKEA